MYIYSLIYLFDAYNIQTNVARKAIQIESLYEYKINTDIYNSYRWYSFTIKLL